MKRASKVKSTYRFVTVSTCPDAWGGSEELWSRAASIVAEKGHRVSVFKTLIDEMHPSIQRLKSLSCPVRDLERVRLPQRLLNLLLPARYQLTPARKHVLFLAPYLKLRRPDLVIISQGDNYDGLHFGHLCRKLKQPYILICQKATDHFWPPDKSRRYMREVFESAVQCFFVSNHNRSLTEDQIGTQLSNASVVRNPFLVPRDKPLSWPGNEDKEWRLACVARLYLLDKGQDILLRVLAQEKWKKRNLFVSFVGHGINREGLIELAKRLEVSKVSFVGQTKDVPGIWKEHHALIMPSRCEGLPLALVEAMLCGRTAIVTNVGGNSEVVEDQVTGFLAAAASEADIDHALEKAWERRQEWREMGQLAASRIRELVPAEPEMEFAGYLMEAVKTLRRAKSDQLAARQSQVREHREERTRGADLNAGD
jgi:glycosyltransferase involved in cell wall biosynthesis